MGQLNRVGRFDPRRYDDPEFRTRRKAAMRRRLLDYAREEYEEKCEEINRQWGARAELGVTYDRQRGRLKGTLVLDGREITLEQRQVAFVEALAERRGWTLSIEILSTARPAFGKVETRLQRESARRSLTRVVEALRKKLEHLDLGWFVQSRKAGVERGYRLGVPVRVVRTETGP